MPFPAKMNYTSADYFNLPEGQRAELIDGELYSMAPPSRIHWNELQAAKRESLKNTSHR